VLTKAAVGLAPGPLDLPGLTDARAFMEEGVARWRRMVERSRIRLDPFAAVGSPEARSEVPRRVAAPGSGGPPGTGDTLFHTGYVWLGSARLVVSVDFESWRADAEGEPSIELRVHRHPTDNPTAVECTYRTTVRITRRGGLRERFELSAEEGWCYAILAKVASGACWVGRGDVSVGPD
jgi:hypothetical protein